MKKTGIRLKPQAVILITATVAAFLIALCLVDFSQRVQKYVHSDTRLRMETIQRNSIHLISSELLHLENITLTAAALMNQAEVPDEAAILRTLQNYAHSADVVRALYVTLDGYVYTSYAGYLGRDESCTFVDGVPISDITEPVISQPFYDDEVGEVIFGVVTPVELAGERGVLVSSYNTSGLAELLHGDLSDNTAEIGIVASDGRTIIGKTADEFGVNIFEMFSQVIFTSSSAETMREDFASGKQGTSSYKHGSVERYCAYSPIGINGWYAVTTVKSSALRGNLAEMERYGSALTAKLVIVMLAAAGVVMLAVFRDQQKSHDLLAHTAHTDSLTGIYNRGAVEDEVVAILDSGLLLRNAAMLVIDIDNFKIINDTQGHIVGDVVLKACARILLRIFPEPSIVGRIGGDEFIVFIPTLESPEELEARVGQLIREFYVTVGSGERQKISVSIGATQVKAHDDTFMEMYQRADTALYQAKQRGKGCFSASQSCGCDE